MKKAGALARLGSLTQNGHANAVVTSIPHSVRWCVPLLLPHFVFRPFERVCQGGVVTASGEPIVFAPLPTVPRFFEKCVEVVSLVPQEFQVDSRAMVNAPLPTVLQF